MLKLKDITFSAKDTDYGIEIVAEIKVNVKATLTHESMNKVGINIEGITKDNLTQEIIEYFYGELRDDFNILLDSYHTGCDLPIDKQNEIYQRTRAVMG